MPHWGLKDTQETFPMSITQILGPRFNGSVNIYLRGQTYRASTFGAKGVLKGCSTRHVLLGAHKNFCRHFGELSQVGQKEPPSGESLTGGNTKKARFYLHLKVRPFPRASFGPQCNTNTTGVPIQLNLAHTGNQSS